MTASRLGHHIIAALDSRIAFRLVQLAAGVALVLSVWIGVQQFELTSCLAKYNEASNASQAQRLAAAEAERQAQDRLFAAVADHPRTAIEEIRRYNETRKAADAEREAHPLPPPPSITCG